METGSAAATSLGRGLSLLGLPLSIAAVVLLALTLNDRQQ
jgi:hypothetical protein